MTQERIPRLQGFFEALQADLRPEVVCTSPSSSRLAERMRKRARIQGSGLSEKAIADFLDLNDSLESFELGLPDELIAESRAFIRFALERFTRSLDPHYIQGVFKWSYLLDNWRFGPGASHDVKGTHAAQKIWQSMTCTEECEPLVKILRASSTLFQGYDALRGTGGVKRVSGSKLATVPKNQDTERTIAIEPSGNMILQLAAGRYLEESLCGIGLDIRCQQPKNKALAMRGSVDGSLATIDLKSASDRITPALVQALFPPEWYRLLSMLRSPVILANGEYVRLNMISTMGNGFTFPLMTLVITSLVYAVRRLRGGPVNWIDWTRTAVFGDDIIVPTEEYQELAIALTQAGFVVNHDKSYVQGPFRESCGGDYYLGEDITPFYVKSLDTVPELFVAINSVLLWSARHRALHKGIGFLLGELRTELSKSSSDGRTASGGQGDLFRDPLVDHMVPEWSNPDAGILTAGCPRRYKTLQPVLFPKRLPSDLEKFFGVALAAGGYGVALGDGLSFLPRTKRVRYKARKSRLPRGYLDGRSAAYCTASESRLIEFFLTLHA